VTEHQGEVKRCPACGVENQANFPAEAHSPVQYGPRLKGLMVYLQDAQLIPSGRTAELLREVFGEHFRGLKADSVRLVLSV
jgi:transposase